ncbi:hypothetical protein [Sphingomonas jeddahensis]|uniref:Uncharacterized protein n=1 Tax=Sphingomonas jeddahensis TaxID=1915074 RepID=A0A1V2EY42_9SPHN|nr:hypothetical protein [Sphingomonas jeddahensis]ONF97109.1 hypothetical protein SPHI_05460 [Sphingomonas jeddahensis]
MDLNELFFRHQVCVERAAMASSVEAKVAHWGLASGYARRISDLRADNNTVELVQEAAA